MEFKINKVNFANGILKIYGKHGFTDKLKLIVYTRMDQIDLIKPRKIIIDPTMNGEDFEFIIDFSKYAEEISANRIWDIEICYDDSIEKIKLESIEAEYFSLKNTLFEAKPYITANGVLAIWVKVKSDFNINILDVFNENKSTRIIFNYGNSINKERISDFQIYLRKRDNKNIELYSEEVKLPIEKIDDNKYSLIISQKSIPVCKKIYDEEVWDLFIKLKEYKTFNMYEKLKVTNWDNAEYNLLIEKDEGLISNKIVINNKHMQYRVLKKELKVSVDYIELNEENILTFNGYLNASKNIKVNNIYLRPRKHSNSLLWDYNNKYLNYTCNENEFLVEEDLNSIIGNLHIEDKLIFDIFIELLDILTNEKIEYAVSIDNIEEYDFEYLNIKDSNFWIKPYKTFANTLALYIKKEMNILPNNAIKLGILGSCYSRSAFVSKKYFNPFYKEKYEVVFTQFHSSIPSVMSKPAKYEEEFFDDINVIHKEYVKNDFEKGIIEKLVAANPDYVLIDLYADAVRDLIVFEDGSIVTGTFIIKETEYLYSLSENVRIITHENKAEFLKYWILATNKFIQELLKHFKPEQLIIQKARMIDKYYDKNNNIKEYKDNKYLIKRSNYYFEFMEEYLLKKVPQMNVINLNDSNFIGHEGFPYGHSVNHYEERYYKELVNKLDDIVLKNKCNIKH